MVDHINLGDDVPTFISVHFNPRRYNTNVEEEKPEDLGDGVRLVYSVYFILTTLSTVGYGDFYPVSILEKIVGSLIMFCGVTFFSIIMNEFIGIILELKGDS